ncbi:hypothetical protein Q5752_000711 [Cryptotrichosporon argae]
MSSSASAFTVYVTLEHKGRRALDGNQRFLVGTADTSTEAEDACKTVRAWVQSPELGILATGSKLHPYNVYKGMGRALANMVEDLNSNAPMQDGKLFLVEAISFETYNNLISSYNIMGDRPSKRKGSNQRRLEVDT